MGTAVETVVIGAGPAGLATSYHLSKRGREHLVLERGSVAESWRGRRWDSFRLVTPNWFFQLPGCAYEGNDRDQFMSGAEVVDRLELYADSVRAPLRCRSAVTALRALASGYVVEFDGEQVEAANVVVATGAYQKPHVPAFRARLDCRILQLSSDDYRNPAQLPPGGVLVVGSGQSGVQIADDLLRSGRQVYLSVGSCGWVPRCYRGRDIAAWLVEMGLLDRTVDSLPSPSARLACFPQVSGLNGGCDLNVHTLARDGAVLLGRVVDAERRSVLVAPDLEENLASADAFAARIRSEIDDFAPDSGWFSEQDPAWPAPRPRPGSIHARDRRLDLGSAGVKCVVWASGFRPSFGWIELPIFDQQGFPVHRRGITKAPGLYFVGLPWLHKWKSATLLGVGEDADFIAEHIVAAATHAGC